MAQQQVVFIDAEYVKAYSQVGGNVDDKYLLSAILTAQDKYIQPLLGTYLYDDLKTNIDGLSSANANYPLTKYLIVPFLKYPEIMLLQYQNQKLMHLFH